MSHKKQISDELTLREFVLYAQDFGRFFLRKWYWILIGAFFLGGCFLINAYMTSNLYLASLTFLLNEEEDGNFGAAAVLGSLGLGSDKGNGVGPRLLELSKSRQIVKRVLFDTVSVANREDLLANFILQIYDYDEKWKDNEVLNKFRFRTAESDSLERYENIALKSLHHLLTNDKDGLVRVYQNDVTGIFEMTAETFDPELSEVLIQKLYSYLSQYFIQASVGPQQKTLAVLNWRADSVKVELSRVERELARIRDRARGMVLNSEVLRQSQLSRDALLLTTLYGEIIKNRETAAFLLSKRKPVFILIDGPLQPLTPRGKSKLKAFLLGSALGGFILLVLLFFYKTFSDALKEK